MIKGVTLRPLSEDDLDFLFEVRHHPDTLSCLHDQRMFTQQEVKEWFRTHNPQWLVVEKDGNRAGYIRISEKNFELRMVKIGMDIHPDCRRQGIATTAYGHLFRQLRQKGWETVWLEVLNSNLVARSLYEKLGFTYDDEHIAVDGHNLSRKNSLVMYRALV